MSKIYLSLDDLHKLYGISPTVINAIKNKRRKRRTRNTKNKINNKQMGSIKNSSENMIGTSNAISIATNRLNNANIDKHIAEINKYNKELENKKPEIIKDLPKNKDMGVIQQLMNGVNSGDLAIQQGKTKNSDKISLIHKHPAIKSNKGRVEIIDDNIHATQNKKTSLFADDDDVDDLGFSNSVSSSHFRQAPIKISPLTTTQFSSTILNNSQPEIDLNDGSGNIAVGVNSDAFQIQDKDKVDLTTAIIDANQKIVDDKLALEEEQKQIEEQKAIDEQKIIDEQKAIDLQNKPYSPKSIKSYDVESLKQLLIDNGLKFKTRDTKSVLYEILKAEQIV